MRIVSAANTMRAAIAVCFVGWLMVAAPAHAGHPAGECQRYAKNAIDQLNLLRSLNCPVSTSAKMWAGNYDEHYNWCATSNGDLGQEFKKRRLVIEACQRHSDAECRKYADNAVRQTREAVAQSCPGVAPPLWGENFQPHYDWCRSDVNGDLGREFKKRRTGMIGCPGSAATTAKPPSITAEVALNTLGQRILRVAGSGFPDNRTITITYTILQSRPGERATESQASFTAVSKGGAVFGEVGVSCPLGYETEFRSVVAKDLAGTVSATAPFGTRC